MNKKFKINIAGHEIMDSIERREYAYINSAEYKQLCREKNWIIIKLFVVGWTGALLILTLMASRIHYFILFN
jgi:hypothetical protein